MVAYEIHLRNGQEDHFIGTLPERRKDPERITVESILNWGKMILGERADADNIYFVKIEV